MAELRRRKPSSQPRQEPVLSDNLLSKLRKLDVYPKLQEDYKVQTSSGATVSIVSGIIMALLFFSELGAFLTPTTTDHIVVDTLVGERLQINLNITFFHLSCLEANLDAMDVAGEQQLNLDHTIVKRRIDSNGQPLGEDFVDDINNKTKPAPLPADYCGSCFGALPDGQVPCCICNSLFV